MAKSTKRNTGKNRFVVHKHDATTPHFDFRLEMDGVLRSWAVPKGVSKTSGVKRLAIPTNDHSLDYIDFEGKIPEGEYGAGLVEIFDSGVYAMIERKEASLKFELYGKVLKGTYVLHNFQGKNWILFQMKKEK